MCFVDGPIWTYEEAGRRGGKSICTFNAHRNRKNSLENIISNDLEKSILFGIKVETLLKYYDF